eukprot:UN14326
MIFRFCINYWFENSFFSSSSQNSFILAFLMPLRHRYGPSTASSSVVRR